MVFFAVCPPEEGGETHSYRFCGALTVAEKISHADIWCIRRHRRFKGYLNLLMRKHGDGWEHHEPALHEKYWHDDWLWRMTSGRDGVRKAQFALPSATPTIPTRPRVGRRPIDFADNYVIFSDHQSESFVHPSPPVVARCAAGQDHEDWEDTRLAQTIYEITVDHHPRRWSLRIANQMAHPHIRTQLSPEGAGQYVQQLREVCEKYPPRSRVAKRGRTRSARQPC